MDSSGKSSGKRPELIGRLIDCVNEKDNENRISQSHFHRRIQTANECLESFPLSVHLSYKIIEPGESKSLGNSSLLLIFGFYSRMEQIYTATFSLTSLANETMSLKELDIFSRNFNLYKILTPIDVREVFHIMQERWRSEQIANQKLAFVLTFDGFVEMLVRLALVAYNKRGLKRIISSIKGRNSMPTNRDIVQYFCHFLHLDDEAYVDNIILTVGRATQGDINYRSASETSTRIRDQLQEDVSKKRMMNDENQLMGESKYSDSSSVHLRSPISPVSKHIASSSSSVATGHSRILKSDPYKDSRLPSELLEKLEGSSKYGGNYDEMTESGYRYDGDQSLYTTGSSLAETNDIYEASCERIFAESYDSSLLNLLKCYRISSGQCYINTSTTCKGPYIDMGVLRAGNKYVIEIKLTNKKASKVSIDVTSAGLDSSKIVTHPAPIISGFSRKVYVMFCANSNDINRSSCYASIHITAGSQELTCPVCFTVRNE